MTGTADWYARTQGPSAPMLLSPPAHALGHGSFVPGGWDARLEYWRCR